MADDAALKKAKSGEKNLSKADLSARISAG